MTENKLATKNAAFGRSLVQEALKESNEARKERLIGRVRLIHDSISTAEEIIAKNKEGIGFFKAQLKALEQGEFVFGPGDEIIFDDEHLRRVRAFS
jgi:hypothetical protein